MKISPLSIIILLIINISFFIYHSLLDSKVQSFTNEFENYTTTIIDRNTDIEDFQCLYNRSYFPEAIDRFYRNNIRDYKAIKGKYGDYVEGRNKGHSINLGILTIKCLSTSQRVFNYNVDLQIRNKFNELKRYMMIGPQGMYLHRQSIQIMDDGSKGFCNAAWINTDRVDYSFEIAINGQTKGFHYAENIMIDNASIEGNLISITVFYPCEEEHRREFRLRI